MSSSAYNALGFDPTNNYLYAITLGGNHLVQIDANGGVTDLAAGHESPGRQQLPIKWRLRRHFSRR